MDDSCGNVRHVAIPCDLYEYGDAKVIDFSETEKTAIARFENGRFESN